MDKVYCVVAPQPSDVYPTMLNFDGLRQDNITRMEFSPPSNMMIILQLTVKKLRRKPER
jgi:hypothetical protein